MRLDRRTLAIHALAVLDEVMDGAPASGGLRLALAYLYAAGDGDRHWFDSFWKAARRSGRDRRDAEAFGIKQSLNASMNAICRSVRLERDAELDRELRRARLGGRDR